MNKLNKKAAIELSIGTIVIIVLAMAMLILGLVLVKNIFSGATYNVDQLNKNVEAEINKLFNEKGDTIVLYLANSQTEIKQGKSFGVAFGVKNYVEGDSTTGHFSYKVGATSVQKGCKLTIEQANDYLILGDTGSFDLAPGGLKYSLVKVQPPATAPLCEIQYTIDVTKEGQPYNSAFFIVKIV